jgi:hypothetical protein
MIRTVFAAAVAVGLLGAPAFADEVTAEEQEKIMALLADMKCEMDEADIEKEDDGGFELDDVFCSDGQYDIDLDANFEVTNKKAE